MSGSQFYEWLFGPEKFSGLSRDRPLIFKRYDNCDGGCSRFGCQNVLLVCYLGIYELLDKKIEYVPRVFKL